LQLQAEGLLHLEICGDEPRALSWSGMSDAVGVGLPFGQANGMVGVSDAVGVST